MPYIGSSASPLPVNFAAVQAQSFNGTGSQTAFTLSRTVPSAASIEVLVNNVQQSPYDASYSVSGTTLTFSEAPSSGTNNVYVVYRDQSLGSLVDESAYRKAEVDSAVATKVSKAGDTMTGALALPAGGLNVGSGQLAVDASGRVTMSSQPAFFASGISGAYGSGATLQWNTDSSFVGSLRNAGFNNSTGRYTAPVTGLYSFQSAIYTQSPLPTNSGFTWQKNGTQLSQGDAAYAYFDGGGSGDRLVSSHLLIELVAGDSIGLQVRSGYSGFTVYGGHSRFSGFLIG